MQLQAAEITAAPEHDLAVRLDNLAARLDDLEAVLSAAMAADSPDSERAVALAMAAEAVRSAANVKLDGQLLLNAYRTLPAGDPPPALRLLQPVSRLPGRARERSR